MSCNLSSKPSSSSRKITLYVTICVVLFKQLVANVVTNEPTYRSTTIITYQPTKCNATNIVSNIRQNYSRKNDYSRLEHHDTIYNVKEKIWDKDGIPPNLQRLVCRAIPLQDENSLLECDIHKESTVHCMLGIVGGMEFARATAAGEGK